MGTKNARHSDTDRHACDNCGAVWNANELEDIKDLGQRVDPGGVVPSGECPDCGALCYPVEKKKSNKAKPSKTREAMKKALRVLNVIREDQSSGPERMVLQAIAALEKALTLKQSQSNQAVQAHHDGEKPRWSHQRSRSSWAGFARRRVRSQPFRKRERRR